MIHLLTLIAALIVPVKGQAPPVVVDSTIPPRVHQILQIDTPVQNVRNNEKLSLECSASGNPSPLVEWSLNGVKFQKDVPFDGKEGSKVRHKLSGNSLTIDPVVAGIDSGRYRCIATNTVGSVFMEKNIQIRVLGVFNAGSRFDNEPTKLFPTLNRRFEILCPPHAKGYGTTYGWGIVDKKTMRVEEYRAGEKNEKGFPTLDGRWVYAFIEMDDIIQSRDIGGLRCVLYNFGYFEASNQQLLWTSYDEKPENRQAELVAFMPEQMTAPVDTEFTIVCGATGRPLPKITWQYQGINVEPLTPGGSKLNFEFFEFLGGRMQLKIRRVTMWSGGTFRCYAKNDRGIDWRDGQLTVHFPPLWNSVFPDFVDLAVGNPFQIVCNASGVPVPQYEWYQNGTLIVNATHRFVRDGVLTFREVTFSDHGIYICLAINVLDTITMSTLLQVKAMAPFFEVPLDNPIYIFRASRAFIECPVKGGPIPTRQWSINNKIVTTGGRFTVFENNGTLIIDPVLQTDEGEYKCEATNELGKRASSADVKVLEPVIITHPPLQRRYSEGWPYAEIFCGASWDHRLDLRIEWYKSGVLMTKFDDHKLYLERRASGPPRILFISNLTYFDAANYSCHAYTKVGSRISEDRREAALIVKAPPRPPTGVKVVNQQECKSNRVTLEWILGEEIGVEARNFYVEFSTNASANQGIWFGGKQPVGSLDTQILAEGARLTRFTITKEMGLPSGANLIFRVTSAYEDGYDRLIGEPSKPSQVGTCITPQSAPIRNPRNVTGFVPGPGRLIVQWLPITDVYQGAADFEYVIGYREAGTPRYNTRSETNITKTSFEIPSAGVNKQYEFYVQSKNVLGLGPEPKSVMAFSGDEPLVQEVRNFRVVDNAMFSTEFGWDPVPRATGYRITYWNITDAEDMRGRIDRKRRAVGAEIVKRYYYFWGSTAATGGSIANLTSQLTYMATVAPMNNVGAGSVESAAITFVTAASTPGPPFNVKLNVYGESVHLSWNPPLDPNGYIEQYDIAWRESGRDNEDGSGSDYTGKMSMDRRSREAYLIRVFKPLTYYDIKMAARNRIGPGFDWDRILMAVSAEDVPGKPGAPMVMPFDDSSINITFQRPNYGGLPSEFWIYYRPRGLYFQEPRIAKQKFPDRAWFLVMGLEFAVYDFWTVGVNELGLSETSDVAESRPIRRPKPQAHASEFPWWKSNWFIAITVCALFVFIIVIVVVMLLRRGPNPYERFDNKEEPEAGPSGTRMQSYNTKAGAASAAGAAAAGSAYNGAAYSSKPYGADDDYRHASSSEQPSDHAGDDAPPPRYSSQGSIEKKPLSDDERSRSASGSGSEYSQSGSGSEYSDEEGGSYYSDEEKKKDDEDENEFSSFV